jgi:hypothetical protein
VIEYNTDVLLHLKSMNPSCSGSSDTVRELKSSCEAQLVGMQQRGLHASTKDRREELYAQCCGHLMTEDVRLELKTVYGECLTIMRECKSGILFGDPWRKHVDEKIKSYTNHITHKAVGRDFCTFFMFTLDKLQKLQHAFSNDAQRLVAIMTQHPQAHKQVIEAAKISVRSHIEQLRTQGKIYVLVVEFIACASSKVPDKWLKRYVELMEINSFSSQQLFEKDKPSQAIKRVKGEQPEIPAISESIAKEVNFSLLYKLLDTVRSHGRDSVSFQQIVDFAQRYHLLLLKLKAGN